MYVFRRTCGALLALLPLFPVTLQPALAQSQPAPLAPSPTQSAPEPPPAAEPAPGAPVGSEVAPASPTAPAAPAPLEQEFEQAKSDGPPGRVNGAVEGVDFTGPVEGARVYVRGAPVDTLTDSSGHFSVELPQGTYQFSIIHPQFSTQYVPAVHVRSGQERKLEIQLTPASGSGDEIVITGAHIKGGVAQLIQERRETTAVADVIGAEQMARSGSSNAAAALSRVTGLTIIDGKYVVVRGMGERYSSLMLNRLQVPSPDPTRRVVPLDLFPTGVLESVVVQKTYSPDMPGEFGGGTVQLRTRGYPDRLIANVSVSAGYNTQTTFRNMPTYDGGKYDWLGFDDDTRKLPSSIDNANKIQQRSRFDPPGKNYSAEEIKEFGKALPNNYATHDRTVPVDSALVLSIGDAWKLRHAKIGFVAAVGYKDQFDSRLNQPIRNIGNGSTGLVVEDDFRTDNFRETISLSNFLDWGVEFNKNHNLKFTSMLLRVTEDETVSRSGPDDGDNPSTRTRLSWVENQIFNQQASGKHVFPSLREFQIDWRYAYGRASRTEPDRRDYQYLAEDDAQPDVYFLSPASGDNQRLYGELHDTSHEGDLDLSQPFGVWNRLKAKAKVGGFIYRRERDSEVRRFEFVPTNLTPEQRAKPPEEIFTAENIDSGALKFIESTDINDTYEASQHIDAGYAMLELPVVKSLDLMGGARVEHAVIKVSTRDVSQPDKPPTIADLDNLDVLPAATLTWRFIEDFQLRGGYNRTLNRPDIRELSPAKYQDITTNTEFIGNAELKRATIDSYDARVEWYYTSDEVFSVGGFYKRFQDPIEIKWADATDPLFQPANTDEAKLLGLELEGRKRFSFIHEKLDQMYLASNFTYMRSRVNLSSNKGEDYHRPLQGQSPWVVNLQLGYDDSAKGGNGLAVSLLYNVFGERMRVVGKYEFGLPDQYEQPVHQLDLVASQVLPRDLNLGLRVQNILNPHQKWTQGDAVVRSYQRGTTFTLTLAWGI